MQQQSNSLLGNLISNDKTNPKEKFRRHDPLIWILSPDLEQSARWLSDKYLEKSIKNAVQILFCIRYYLLGIRNARLFKIYFNPKNYHDRVLNFVNEVLNVENGKFTFRFINYDAHTTKWARKCKGNCKFIEDALIVYLQESKRRGKNNKNLNIGLYLSSENPASNSLSDLKTGGRMLFEPKNIPHKFLKGLKLNETDIWTAYRRYYASKIEDPLFEYSNSKADIPNWLLNSIV